MTKAQYRVHLRADDITDSIKEMFRTLYQFIVDTGIGQVFAGMDSKAKAEEVKRIHDLMVMNNQVFPDDLDMFVTYSAFFTDVAYGRAQIREKSIFGITSTFKNWLASSQILAELQEKQRPKYININDQSQADRGKLPLYLEDWDDREIQRQLSIITMIGFKGVDFPGAGGYMARIFKEAERRGIKPVPVQLGP